MPASETSLLPLPTAILFGLSGCLVDFGCVAPHMERDGEDALTALTDHCATPTPGALETLCGLHRQGLSCAWLERLPEPVCARLTTRLPFWLSGMCLAAARPWPAPDGCWQALAHLQVAQLEGCVLVAGDTALLQAGLAAGLWTVGLVTCGPLCGLSPAQWAALDERERERLRSRATVELYNMGVHSVIDDLTVLDNCLADIASRRVKGEKP